MNGHLTCYCDTVLDEPFPGGEKNILFFEFEFTDYDVHEHVSLYQTKRTLYEHVINEYEEFRLALEKLP